MAAKGWRSSPQLTDDGSRTAHSERYAQTYHSTYGAVTEARHVFIHATGIADRLRRRQDTRVLEIGFGLGLNVLLTADLALDLAREPAHKLARDLASQAPSDVLPAVLPVVPPEHRPAISYHAFEHDLIGATYFESLGYEAVLNHPELAASMADMLRSADTAHNAPISSAGDLSCGFHLTLHLEDATGANCGFFTLSKNTFHAIYLDAFCPEANPECWTPEFIARLAEMLSDDGFLSTYSAKGSVRRAMLQAGLHVKKLPGPPGKREMLLAHR